MQLNNANNVFAVCSASCTLSLRMASVSSLFEATGSKSASLHYEKPDLLCQWETICSVVLALANKAFFCVLCGTQLHMHRQTHSHKMPPPLLCHMEDHLALGNTVLENNDSKTTKSSQFSLLHWGLKDQLDSKIRQDQLLVC